MSNSKWANVSVHSFSFGWKWCVPLIWFVVETGLCCVFDSLSGCGNIWPIFMYRCIKSNAQSTAAHVTATECRWACIIVSNQPGRSCRRCIVEEFEMRNVLIRHNRSTRSVSVTRHSHETRHWVCIQLFRFGRLANEFYCWGQRFICPTQARTCLCDEIRNLNLSTFHETVDGHWSSTTTLCRWFQLQ